jgi:hypothetical protein
MSIGPDWNMQFNFQKPTASTIAALAEKDTVLIQYSADYNTEYK